MPCEALSIFKLYRKDVWSMNSGTFMNRGFLPFAPTPPHTHTQDFSGVSAAVRAMPDIMQKSTVYYKTHLLFRCILNMKKISELPQK
jgi:hypothetical protein